MNKHVDDLYETIEDASSTLAASNLPSEYLKERFEMIVRYENPPNKEDLLALIKKIFAQNGYDTPDKRTEVPKGCERDP